MTVVNFLAGAVGVSAVAVVAFVAAPDPMVPNNELTPGIVASADSVDVCGRIDGRTYSQRHRSERHDKYRIMRAYGYDPNNSSKFELDHRVPLALGGADMVANLWPEYWAGQMNAHDKDDLESWAWRAVCVDGSLGLTAAQSMFLGDWREAYRQFRATGWQSVGAKPVTE